MAFKNNTQLIGVCFNSIKIETYNAVKYVRRACIIYSNFCCFFLFFVFHSSLHVLFWIRSNNDHYSPGCRAEQRCVGDGKDLFEFYSFNNTRTHTHTRKYICILLHVGFRRRSVSPVDVILSRRRTSNKYVVDRAVEAYTCKV